MERMSGKRPITQNCRVGIRENKAQKILILAKEAKMNKKTSLNMFEVICSK